MFKKILMHTAVLCMGLFASVTAMAQQHQPFLWQGQIYQFCDKMESNPLEPGSDEHWQCYSLGDEFPVYPTSFNQYNNVFGLLQTSLFVLYDPVERTGYEQRFVDSVEIGVQGDPDAVMVPNENFVKRSFIECIPAAGFFFANSKSVAHTLNDQYPVSYPGMEASIRGVFSFADVGCGAHGMDEYPLDNWSDGERGPQSKVGGTIMRNGQLVILIGQDDPFYGDPVLTLCVNDWVNCNNPAFLKNMVVNHPSVQAMRSYCNGKTQAQCGSDPNGYIPGAPYGAIIAIPDGYLTFSYELVTFTLGGYIEPFTEFITYDIEDAQDSVYVGNYLESENYHAFETLSCVGAYVGFASVTAIYQAGSFSSFIQIGHNSCQLTGSGGPELPSY